MKFKNIKSGEVIDLAKVRITSNGMKDPSLKYDLSEYEVIEDVPTDYSTIVCKPNPRDKRR